MTLLFTGGSDTDIHIWESTTGELIGSLTTHRQRINALAVSNDGNYLVSVGADKMMVVWDIHNHFEVINKYQCEEECTTVVFHENSLFCGYVSGVIREWPLYNQASEQLFSSCTLNSSPKLEKIESFRLDWLCLF